MSDRGIAMMLICSLISVCLSGIAALFLNRAGAHISRWVVSTTLFGFLVSLIIGWINILDSGLQSRNWTVGWVVSKPEFSTIRVGISLDPIGVGSCCLWVLLAALVLINVDHPTEGVRADRAYAASAFSVSGVGLSWISATPWLSFVGLTFALFAGCCAFSGTEEENGWRVAPKYLLERSSGLILALAGMFMLSSAGVNVSWFSAEAWPPEKIIQIGAAVFSTGLFLQFGATPILGFALTQEGLNQLPRLLGGYLAGGWAALALFFRLSNHLAETEILIPFAWICVISAILSLVVGLFQIDFKRILGAYVPALFCTSIAAFAFGSPLIAYGLLVGWTLGVVTLLLTALMVPRSTVNDSMKKKSVEQSPASFLILVVLAVCLASGGMGWVSHWALNSWLRFAASDTTVCVFSVLMQFLAVVVVWRMGWLLLNTKRAFKVSGRLASSAFACLLVSLSVFWTGEPLGLGLFSTEIWSQRPLLERMFLVAVPAKAATLEFRDESGVFWAYLAIVVLGGLTAFWMRHNWIRFFKSVPKAAAFISSGYRTDRFWGFAAAHFIRWGAVTDQLISEGFWTRVLVIPSRMTFATLSKNLLKADEWILSRTGFVLERALYGAVRLPQWIQSGDVQAYLLFAIGSTVVLLIKLLMN